MLLTRGKKFLMTNDIIQELKNALRNDRYPYDETVYVRAIEEIEMLRTICNDLRTELQQATAQISDSDIVARLKSAVEVHKDGISNYGNDFYFPSTSCNACERLNDAADEIERLRMLGDAVARSYERAFPALGIDWAGRQQALRAWQEARRG